MPWQCFMAQSEEERKKPGAMWMDPTKPKVVGMLIKDCDHRSLE